MGLSWDQIWSVTRHRSASHAQSAQYEHQLTDEEAWQEILDKMIWSFNEAINQYSGEFESEQSLTYWAKVQNGFTLFGQYYINLWD